MPEARELRIDRVPFTHPDAQRLVAEVQAEYVVRYGGPDETPLEPTMFDPPRGAFFVGYEVQDTVSSARVERFGKYDNSSGRTRI